MAKKGSSAASDPFAGVAAVMQAQAAADQTALGRDWLAFSKEQFGIANERQKGIDALTNQVTGQQLESMKNANQWAVEDRARWKSIFQPMQDKFIDKANNWDSAAHQAEVAAEAKADVANNVAAQNAQRERALAAKGIRPDSGEWAGIDRAAGTEAALASAGAENTARNQVRQQAIGLQGDALNIGSGLPSQALSAVGTGVDAGTSATGNSIAANSNWRSNIGIMNSGFGGAGSLYDASSRMWASVYGNRVGVLNAQDQMNAAATGSVLGGVGSLVGMGIGAYRSGMLSDEDAKEDKREVKGILDALKKMPVEAWKYKEGQGDGGEHIGTYAQDFQKATGLGDGKNINIVDAIGVTMGAVKELAEKVEEMKGGKDGDEKKPARTAARSAPKAKSIMMKKAA